MKKTTDASLADLKKRVSEVPKVPPGLEDLSNGARDFLEAAKTSAKDNQVTAEVSVEPEIAARFIMGMTVRGSDKPKVPPIEIKGQNREGLQLYKCF